MSYDYEVYTYGVSSSVSGAILQDSANNNFCSADGSVCSITSAVFSKTVALSPTDIDWKNAGSALLVSGGTVTFSPGLSTSGLMYLYFSPDPTVTSGTVSMNLTVLNATSQPCTIKPMSYSQSGGGTSWTITSTGNSISVSIPYDQIFAMQLNTVTTQTISVLQTSTSSTLLLQAFSAQKPPSTTLTFPTLRNRGTLTRDVHGVSDTGAFVVPPPPAQFKVGETASYAVTAFGVLERSSAIIKPGNEYYFVSADTSVSSEALSNSVTTSSPHVTLTADSNQSVWGGAGILGSNTFTFNNNNGSGIVASTITLFFVPPITETATGPQLANLSTSFSVSSGSSNFPLQLSSESFVNTASGWTLGTAKTGDTSMVLTAPSASSMLLPYVQLQFTGSTAPPPITSITSSTFLLQAFAGSNVQVGFSSDLTSACFNYTALTAANIPLYLDTYGNTVLFGQSGASFCLANNALNNATNALYPVSVNTLQTTTPAAVGPYMVEQRIVENGSWYTVQQNPAAGAYLPTRYSFVEYTPKAGEYSNRSTPVVLLYAENIPLSGGTSVSGYVSCSTIATYQFAMTAENFSAPLLTQQEAVAKQIQWGLVMSTIKNQNLTGGPRLPQQRVFSLIYCDANLAPNPLPLTVAIGNSTTPNTLPDATSPLPVAGFASSWLAHGVWMPNSQNSLTGVEYNSTTLEAQLQDTYNIITGSGFTNNNTNIQWLISPPTLTPTEAKNQLASIVSASQQAQSDSAAASKLAVQAYDSLPRSVFSEVMLGSATGQAQSQIAAQTSSLIYADAAQSAAGASLTSVQSLVSNKVSYGSTKQKRTKVIETNKNHTPLAIGVYVVASIVIVVSIAIIIIFSRKR